MFMKQFEASMISKDEQCCLPIVAIVIYSSPTLGLGWAHIHLQLPQNLTNVVGFKKHGVIL